ncbi:hypothetical protein TI04_02935 [Achromatium sp. WMS2]|nr:hypothetical protein TI04_02935 [Achromatium sp. WMS2]
MTPERLLQVLVGKLDQPNFPAYIPYNSTTPWIVAHDENSVAIATEVCEGVTLQLLKQHLPKQAKLYFFEAAPSQNFKYIKRILADAEQQWGKQLFTANECISYIKQCEELVRQRFTLLAQSKVADIHQYNINSARVEPIIYLMISGLGTDLSEHRFLQQLDMLGKQGGATGIVLLLLRNRQEETAPYIPELRRNQLAAFWQSMQTQAVGLDLQESNIQPINIPSELWRLLQRFNIKLGLGSLCDELTNALLEQIKQPEDSSGNYDFLHIAIGHVGHTPAYLSMGEKSNAYHALIGGATRTGKTTLINNIILKACEEYPPQTTTILPHRFQKRYQFLGI